MRRLFFCVLALFLLSTSLTCFSQQTDIRQWSTFEAFSYLSTPSLNLTQRGFDADIGYNWKSWITLGFDFSYNNGHSSLLPQYLNSTTKAKLAPFLPILQELGIPVVVPYNSSTYTYEAGPQFNYRHFKKVTLFARPALGALHATVNTTPSNPVIQEIVAGLLNGKTSKSDTVVFYGFGGGVTWEITPNFGLRVASDFVHYNYFSDILGGGRNSVRVVVGTKFSFGKNIVKK
jgi:opacity protein-like surface antigen